MPNLNDEPVSVLAAINGAVVATIALLAFVGVDGQVIGALSLAATAWIAVAATIVRGRVTPTDRVALTVKQAEQLEAQRASQGTA